VGGINAGNLSAWRTAGVAGFGTGSSLNKPADEAQTVATKAKALVRFLSGSTVTSSDYSCFISTYSIRLRATK
jgi:2-dehydro-3-deoxyphosphogalactonate aldolase